MENVENEVRRSNENTDFVIDDEPNLEFDLDENGVSSSKLYNPQVSDEIRPKKGQEFETLDDVLKFYNAYAKKAGFSVRSATEKKEPGSNEVRRKEFICWKEGRPKRIADVELRRRRGSIGENCNAKIAVLKSNESSKYVVTVFKEGHSHPLATPTKVHLLPSHRKVSDTAKSIKKQLSMVNIPQHQQFSFLGVQSGGIENIGCTQRDLYNHERDKRADTKGHDGMMFFEYLKLEQGKNPSFTFKIETDDQQKITRCFWSDASSRRAYNYFGKLPDKYILKRWTKGVNLGTVVDGSSVDIVHDGNNHLIRSQFVQSSLDLIDKALLCEETRKMFTDGVCILTKQIDQFIISANVSAGKSNPTVGDGVNSMHASCNVESSFNEPDLVRAKGCGKRLKGGKEKAMARAKNKKVRRCHGCGKMGQAHDKRNCPAFSNRCSPSKESANLEKENESSTEDDDDISLA